jgi:uncharacterized repeat protein (TIGR03803 family)
MKIMPFRKITCFLALFVGVAASHSFAQTFASVTFDGSNGSLPFTTLVEGPNGNLYGTTFGGGLFSDGTVFDITPSLEITLVHSFCPSDFPMCPGGSLPDAGLVLGTDGNFYGTTQDGGANDRGTFFKITPQGDFTVLHSFCIQTNCVDGEYPSSVLLQGRNGNFYGMTTQGGPSSTNGNVIPANTGACVGGAGCGTIFEITPTGDITILHGFCSQLNSKGICEDGEYPKGGLVRGTDGNFYGTTYSGGKLQAGTVFVITPAGNFNTLRSFSRTADGGCPEAGLVQGTDGNFYGTTSKGGSNQVGTVFRMTPSGHMTALYSFCSHLNCADGSSPQAGLVQGNDGNFYGTTYMGGADPNCSYAGVGCGTIFQITPAGNLTTLHSFCLIAGCSDGAFPLEALVQATNGAFYGTTPGGVVFSLSVGLGPFVSANPPFGRVGRHITLLGNNLRGTTNVSFNGASARFTASSSEINTIVPSDATTGTIEVTTPGGTLSSNTDFQIEP